MSSQDDDRLLSNAAPMGQSSTIVPDSVSVPIETQPPQYTPANSQPQAAPGGASNDGAISSILKQSSHPTILIFHVLFRIMAFCLYLFANFLPLDFVLVFVLSVLFLSFDFWVVKNVSGRFLVGLRWWNEVDDLGHSQWYFESKDENQVSNPIDSKLFWITSYSTPVVWLLFALISLIKMQFEWLLIVLVALMLSSTNLLGYYKCEQFAKQKSKSANSFGSNLFSSSNSVIGGFISRSFSSLLG